MLLVLGGGSTGSTSLKVSGSGDAGLVTGLFPVIWFFNNQKHESQTTLLFQTMTAVVLVVFAQVSQSITDLQLRSFADSTRVAMTENQGCELVAGPQGDEFLSAAANPSSLCIAKIVEIGTCRLLPANWRVV